MIIDHPLLGPRDSQEFVYLGDASLIDRPDWQDGDAADSNSMNISICGTIRPVNIGTLVSRDGDRSWLIVTRNTVTHEITKVLNWPVMWHRSRGKIIPRVMQMTERNALMAV